MRETGGHCVVRTFKVMLHSEDKGKVQGFFWRLRHVTSTAEQKPRAAVLLPVVCFTQLPPLLPISLKCRPDHLAVPTPPS